jgi:hypothetical protein
VIIEGRAIAFEESGLPVSMSALWPTAAHSTDLARKLLTLRAGRCPQSSCASPGSEDAPGLLPQPSAYASGQTSMGHLG